VTLIEKISEKVKLKQKLSDLEKKLKDFEGKLMNSSADQESFVEKIRKEIQSAT